MILLGKVFLLLIRKGLSLFFIKLRYSILQKFQIRFHFLLIHLQLGLEAL